MASFWQQAKQTNSPKIGRVSYQKIADKTADELNRHLTQRTVTPDRADPGKKISVYNLFNNNQVAPDFTAALGAKNGIDIYKITYRTTAPELSKRYQVTGLLAIPANTKGTTLPLASYQHGTILFPEDAPSNLFREDQIQRAPSNNQPFSSETLFNLVKLGGNGYIVAAADYIGNNLERPRDTQAYGIKGATVQTTKDMLKASRAVIKSLGRKSDQTFLNGWSQGGTNSQWLNDSLQRRSQPAKAMTSAAAPSDSAATMKYWANDFGVIRHGSQQQCRSYLAPMRSFTA